MKFTIKKSIILDALSNAVRALSTKITIPVLNGILFNLTEQGLEVQASDSELTIKTTIELKDIINIESTGRAVLQSRCLLEIIRKMPNDVINFELTDNNNIKIYSDINEYIIECYNIGEYPTITLEKSQNIINIESKLIKQMINQTSYAMSMQEVRPLLTGLNLKINGDILECTATDSYRLASKKIKLPFESNEKINIIIPTRNLNELLKLLNDDEAEIKIHIFNNKIIFMFDTIIFMSRLINGSYPDTSKLIPEEFSTEIIVNLKDLYNSIDRASLLTNEADKNTVKLSIVDNKILLRSNIPEIGNVEEKLDIIESNNNDIKIAFSSKFMMDALKVMECDNVKLLFNGEIKPIIIKDASNDDLIQLILPIRTY